MKYLLVMLFIGVVYADHGDKKSSCCNPTATEEFSAFGNDLVFSELHDAPVPFEYISSQGEMKIIKASDGSEVSLFEIPAAAKTNKFLFVFHEWWGLNDYIKKEAENVYHELDNVTVIALDLYDGKIAATPDSARKYVSTVSEGRIRTIISAAIQYAGKNATIATLG